MTNFDFTKPEETALNPIQPVSDDFSTDGYLPEFARVDHQHPLSESLRAAIFSAGSGVYVRKIGDTMSGDLNLNSGVSITFDGTLSNRIYYFSNLSGMPWMNGPRMVGASGMSFFCNSQATDVFGHRGAAAGGYFWVGNRILIGEGPNDPHLVQAVNVNGNIAFTAGQSLLWQPYSAVSCWAQDNSWFRAGPNMYTNGVCGGQGGVSGGGAGGGMGGYTGFYTAGSSGFLGQVNTGPLYCNGSGAVGALGVRRDQGASHGWSDQQIVAMDGGGANSQEGISFWSSPYGVAPMMRNFGQFGERLDFINSANSAYIGIYAASYNPGSSLRIKEDVEEQSDEEVLRIASSLKVHRYKMKVRPQTIRPTERFKKVATKWEATGHTPLMLKPEHTEIHDHDCDVDFCSGTKKDPCIVVRNDTHKYGLIAEHIHEVAPEITNLDLEMLPDSYDIVQTSSLALAGVGALHRQIQGIMDRIQKLEKKPNG